MRRFLETTFQKSSSDCPLLISPDWMLECQETWVGRPNRMWHTLTRILQLSHINNFSLKCMFMAKKVHEPTTGNHWIVGWSSVDLVSNSLCIFPLFWMSHINFFGYYLLSTWILFYFQLLLILIALNVGYHNICNIFDWILSYKLFPSFIFLVYVWHCLNKWFKMR